MNTIDYSKKIYDFDLKFVDVGCLTWQISQTTKLALFQPNLAYGKNEPATGMFLVKWC